MFNMMDYIAACLSMSNIFDNKAQEKGIPDAVRGRLPEAVESTARGPVVSKGRFSMVCLKESYAQFCSPWGLFRRFGADWNQAAC
jgi:hypothetical protein